MRVVFLQNIKGVAQIGDIKNVADGYARNFLFPKNFAKTATSETVKQAETLKKKQEGAYAASKEEATKLAKKLEGVTIKIKEDANNEGHLYGSVKEKTIVQSLKKQGIIIGEDQIILPQHLKQIGEHEVELELHPEVKSKVKIKILAN